MRFLQNGRNLCKFLHRENVPYPKICITVWLPKSQNLHVAKNFCFTGLFNRYFVFLFFRERPKLTLPLAVALLTGRLHQNDSSQIRHAKDQPTIGIYTMYKNIICVNDFRQMNLFELMQGINWQPSQTKLNISRKKQKK